MNILIDIFEGFGLQKATFPVAQVLSKSQLKKLAKMNKKKQGKDGEKKLGARAKRKLKKK